MTDHGESFPSRLVPIAFNPSQSMPRLMGRRVGGALVLTGGCLCRRPRAAANKTPLLGTALVKGVWLLATCYRSGSGPAIPPFPPEGKLLHTLAVTGSRVVWRGRSLWWATGWQVGWRKRVEREAVDGSRGVLCGKRPRESSGIKAVFGSPYRALGGTVLRGGG